MTLDPNVRQAFSVLIEHLPIPHSTKEAIEKALDAEDEDQKHHND